MSKNRNLLKRCISAIFVGAGGAVGSRVLMFIANIILARVLKQECFGQYSSVSSTVNLFVVFSGIGISSTLTRYIATSRDDKQQLGVYIATLSRICFVFSLFLSGILLIFAEQISELSTGTVELTRYFRIVSITIFFASMASVEQSIMVGFERFKISTIVQIIRCGLFCILGYYLPKFYGLTGAVYALLICHGIQYILSVVLNKRYYAQKQIVLHWEWNDEMKQIARNYAFPAFLSGLLCRLIGLGMQFLPEMLVFLS